jgi:hypothetical protein
VLDLALAEEADSKTEGLGDNVKASGKPSTTAESDKGLLRLYVAFHVLSRLGFSEGRISQCLLEGLEEGGGWDEAIDWVSELVFAGWVQDKRRPSDVAALVRGRVSPPRRVCTKRR